MKIQIGKLKTVDLAKYKELIDNCFDGSNDISVYRENYNETSDSYEIFIAKSDENIVGCLTIYKIDLFTYSFQPALEIFNVCVHPEYRGQKVAKQLFEKVFSYAREHRYKSIYLTCLDTAHDAHRLYESVGMTKTNSIKYSITL